MPVVTTTSRNDLIALTIGMFNAAPGANNLNQLADLYQAGKTGAEIAHAMAARTEFTQVYSLTLSADEFATRLTANMLGNEVSTTTTQWAQTWIKDQLATGHDRATIIMTAVQALQTSTNTDFANAKTMLANRVEVASYYSVTKAMSSASLADLQAVIAGVTSAANTVTYNKALVDSPLIDPISRTYTLTAGTDVIDAGDVKYYDEIRATEFSHLSNGDSIDGGGGNDSLSVYSNSTKIVIPTAITVKNVEIANLVGVAGMSGDTSNWVGLTTLNLTSAAGDISIKAASTTDVKISVGGVISAAPTTAVAIDVSGGAAISVLTNSNVVTTIASPHAGMTVGFSEAGGIATFTTAKLALPAGAALQDYLNAAATGGGANSEVKWFQYQGNTYVVEDNSATSTYVDGIDATVILTGLVDLHTSSYTTTTNAGVVLTLP